jgi:hypothetical protein
MGDGCTVIGTKLPDGTWFGILHVVNADAQTIGLDLACLYTGAAAEAAKATRGGTGPLHDNSYFVNADPQIFIVDTWPNVQVLPIEVTSSGPTGELAPPRTGAARAVDIQDTHNGDRVWVRVANGRAIIIQQVFVS